ncbi:C1 family peptidase [Niabella drilacis]|uniref:Cysteine protease, C1A family n=1 Tax=Niabella drilacis (strain DSM 25811 / CCM 8410 / CCUG 62505 / LMG 26954 / E90) TaxID=1285928 RepID=A0A1G6Q007_NIADE|nr:C1 family peptidase [Niabella drilacis]SDC85551.1 Cysteine protease, C1A family [Niabella drilacis]
MTKPSQQLPGRILGWIPDLPDARDFIYAAPLKVMQKLPAKMDLRKTCPPVYDQGSLGSCTANALGAAFEFGKKKQRKKTFRPSRLFLYYNERVLMHTIQSDSGAYLRDGIKSLNKQGICPETDWPYNEAAFAQKPPAACYKTALKNQVLSYWRIPVNLISVKGCLAEGYPFSFGFSVYESFMTREVADSGIMPLPDIAKESLVGGHAVLAVGYSDVKQMVLVRNSWSKKWGIGGYFWMPYAYIANPAFCQDFWTVRDVE